MSGTTYGGMDKGFVVDNSTPEFRLVRRASQEHVVHYDGTGLPLGVLQENVTETRDFGRRVANVRMEGITRAVADGAIALDAIVYAAPDGRVSAGDGGATPRPRLGRCITPCTAADRQIDLWFTER